MTKTGRIDAIKKVNKEMSTVSCRVIIIKTVLFLTI